MSEDLFNKSILKKCVGDKSFKMLEDKAIDVGANFLAGKTTTAFKKVVNSDAVKSLTTNAISGGAIWGMGEAIVKSFKKDELKQLQIIGENIVAESLSIITQKSGEIVGKQIDKLTNKLLNVPINIFQYGQSYFMTYKKSLPQIMGNLMAEIEDKEIKSLQNYKDSKLKKFTEKTTYRIAKIQKGTEKILNYGTTYLGLTLAYIENGPEYIANETNKQLNKVMRNVNNYIDDKTDVVNKAIDDYCKEAGEEAGQELVIQYNNTIIKTAKNKINKMKNNRKKAVLKANAQIQKATLKLKAMIGG